RIEEVAEKFPTGRGFIDADAKLLRHSVSSCAGGHRTGNALQPARIAGRKMCICCEDRERVRRSYEYPLADNEVSVTIAIRCCAEIRSIFGHHQLIEVPRVNEVGVWMMPAKIFQRDGI